MRRSGGDGRAPSLRELLPQGLASALARGRNQAALTLISLFRLPLLRRLRCLALRRMHPLRAGHLGTPVVRHYWAEFLDRHRLDIRGRALEIGTTMTIWQYGDDRFSQADALDLSVHTPEVNVVADLTKGDGIPSDTWDCFINQFSMNVMYDVESAMFHSIRLLKPGGVALVAFQCADYFPVEGLDMGTGAVMHWFWSFTPIQVHNILRRVGLSEGDYEMEIFGNFYSRLAVTANQAAEELTKRELNTKDPGHSVLIAVRLVKPAGWDVSPPPYRQPWVPSTEPVEWSPATGHYGVRS